MFVMFTSRSLNVYVNSDKVETFTEGSHGSILMMSSGERLGVNEKIEDVFKVLDMARKKESV